MATIAANLQAVKDRIRLATQAAGRDPGNIVLLAASKTWPTAAVREAAAAGQRTFGENYAQEGAEKARALAREDIDWHFIGPVQSNKTATIAANFDWVHTIDRLKIAQRLSAARVEKTPLQVCLQVNVSGEASKSGVAPGELAGLAAAVAALPNLRLRGLMAIPEPAHELEAQRRPFRLLRELLERLNAGGLELDTLSMGMSQDLEAAIAEGATIVRVGTAIFGERARNALREPA
jgi:PLP dependent protein